MKRTLVIMAAGMASRYGGNKQVEGMGPHGEILMEYSIYDALRAGFERVVFIIRPELEDMLRELCGDAISRHAEVRYVVQDYSSIPAFYHIPEDRKKPFGTVHAVLCAEEAVDGPFAVINADDYYGVESFAQMAGFLAGLGAEPRAAMMGYRLRNTVSSSGTVTRGICQVAGGRLLAVDEVKNIQLMPDGSVVDLSDGGEPRPLDPEAPVSMNFWGFPKGVFALMHESFDRFLRNIPEGELKAEALLPNFVDECIHAGTLDVTVLPTAAQWFGVTYQQDRPGVVERLQELHAAGVYPKDCRVTLSDDGLAD